MNTLTRIANQVDRLQSDEFVDPLLATSRQRHSALAAEIKAASIETEAARRALEQAEADAALQLTSGERPNEEVLNTARQTSRALNERMELLHRAGRISAERLREVAVKQSERLEAEMEPMLRELFDMAERHLSALLDIDHLLAQCHALAQGRLGPLHRFSQGLCLGLGGHFERWRQRVGPAVFCAPSRRD